MLCCSGLLCPHLQVYLQMRVLVEGGRWVPTCSLRDKTSTVRQPSSLSRVVTPTIVSAAPRDLTCSKKRP